MRLLLLSNSKLQGYDYLEYAIPYFLDFLGKDVKKIAFVPYAGVTLNWNDYEAKVQFVFSKLGYTIESVHHANKPSDTILNADAIAVGGGNTFKLVEELHKTGLMNVIHEKVLNGTPFFGWSAGANVACPTLRTTNDMPIIEPMSFKALNFVPFQINPHYLDKNPEGFFGETREERIKEFIELNREIKVVGLREGTVLRVENNKMSLLGNHSARIFQYGQSFYELNPDEDFSFLLKS